jgi:transposase InsO family protein
MKYQAIEQGKGNFPVARLCALLHVSESGYYVRRKREPSQRQQQDGDLRETITSIWRQFRGIYGASRIHAELLRRGMRIGRKRVIRLMRQASIHLKARGFALKKTQLIHRERVSLFAASVGLVGGAPGQSDRPGGSTDRRCTC